MTKTLKIFALLFTIFLTAYAPKVDNEKEIKKAYKALNKEFPEFVFIPSATFGKANDTTVASKFYSKPDEKNITTIQSFWMSKYEVSNGQWREFVVDIKNTIKGDSFRSLLPDTNSWLSPAYNEPMQKYYYRHPAYENYPVVNVSLEQCKAYCKWLTNKMNKTEMKFFKNVVVRIPFEMEWEHAARGGNGSATYPWGHFLMNSKGIYMANFRKIPMEKAKKENGKIVMELDYNTYQPNFLTSPVNMYFENGFGLYHIGGNVAEFVMATPGDTELDVILKTKGITRGGSFLDPPYYMQCSVRDFYAKDSSAHFTRGLRPVLTFIK